MTQTITDTARNGDVSFWYRQIGLPSPQASLGERITADVCIVGGGYTGLWTAYYLKRAAPELRIVVLERRFCGFGASGRNGGWLSGALPGIRRRYAEQHGRESVVAMQRLINEAVDEVISVTEAERIEADIVKGGLMQVARAPAQLERLAGLVADSQSWGASESVALGAEDAAARIRVAGSLGASFNPQCARIQPAKLVRGLAEAVANLGVAIYENTPVTEIQPRLAQTRDGAVEAEHILRATEGFTPGIPGARRAWLPMNSSIVVTEPLSDAQWETVGWAGCETLGDLAHAYIYAQRTADGRIAMGGRGVPYRFGSRTDRDGRIQSATIRSLAGVIADMFPSLGQVRIEHAWSGVLGVPRDWCATVGLDPSTGLGWAGGYVGHGVAGTNLAGRTLRDLVLGLDTEAARMPWVNRRVRQWEPEPLRWLGVRGLYVAYRYADRRERPAPPRAAPPHTSRIAKLADAISGRH